MALHVQEPTDFLIPNEPPQEDLTESASRFSMLHLNNANHSPSPTSSAAVAAAGVSGHLHNHPPCMTCGCQGFNPMKRRSPESQLESSRPKKHSCEQEDQTQPSGYSAVSLPLSLEKLAAVHNTRPALPVFRRCFSDPYTVPSAAGAPSTPNTSPENTLSASRLPPRPPSLKRCVSDPSSTPSKPTFQDSCLEDSGMGVDLSKEENSDSMRMRRMKDRLREMKKWWDEVMQEEENQVDEGDKAMSVSQVVEGHKALSVSQDYFGMEEASEEFVSVEWVENSLGVNFKCPCDNGEPSTSPRARHACNKNRADNITGVAVNLNTRLDFAALSDNDDGDHDSDAECLEVHDSTIGNLTYSDYIDEGDPMYECQFCGALFKYNERVRRSRSST